MSKNKISIIIPNYNGIDLLKTHLPQVLNNASGCEVIVVDDNSDDGSGIFIKEHYPEVIFISNTNSPGFAGNVNTGVEAARGDIAVLLNTDVEPQNGFLEPLIRHFADDRVFAVGCMDRSHEKKNIILRGRGLASWKQGYYIHSRGEVNKSDTAWVSGGSSAFRVSIWKKLGGMDEIYSPFYWEDIDLSYRARKAGYRIFFESSSVVDHYHRSGSINSNYTQREIKIIAYRNQFVFIWKNLSDYRIWIQHLFWTPVKITAALVHGDAMMLTGLVRAIMIIPRILKDKKRTLDIKVPDLKL